MPDSEIINNILVQLRLVPASVSLLVAAVVSTAINLFVYAVNRRADTIRDREIEQLRSQLNTNERELQAALDTASHMKRSQYEAEYDAYRDIWRALHMLKRRTSELIPALDEVNPNQARIDERRKAFYEAYDAFSDSLEEQSIFLPSEIYEQLNQASHQIHVEVISRPLDYEDDQDYWEKALASTKRILAALNASRDSIRNRFIVITSANRPPDENL